MPLARARGIPSQETILAISNLDVLDEDGRAVTFGGLFEKQNLIAIFIRTPHPIAIPVPFLCALHRSFLVCS